MERRLPTIKREKCFIEPFLKSINWNLDQFNGLGLSRFFKTVNWTSETKERAGVAITRFGKIYLQIGSDKLLYHKELVSKAIKANQSKDPFPQNQYAAIKRLMTDADLKS